MKVKDQAIVAMTPAADQSANEGFFVEASSGEAAVCNSATDIPLGVIIDGEDIDGKSTIALMAFGGTVSVKAAGTIAVGQRLELTSDGKVVADSASGARVVVAQAVEAGVADELIEAALLGPIVYTA